MIGRHPLIGVLAVAAFASGCPSYLFEQKLPTAVKEHQVIVPAAMPQPSDILFVVDDSCSMDNKQKNLRDNFSAFINEIAGVGDYHIAVVTTDFLSVFPPGGPSAGMPTEFDGVTVSTFANVWPFNFLSIDGTQCKANGIGHGCFRGPDPNKRVITSAMARADQISTFQANANVGSCGSGTEMGLMAVTEALRHATSGDCNGDFLRNDANLVVVILSDEDDTDNTLVDNYVDMMSQYKPYSRIRVATITAEESGDAANCSIAQGASCGQMACSPMPPFGSHMPCALSTDCAGPSMMLPEGEFCQNVGAGMNQCENKALEFWDTTYCGWCTYFNAPDCCTALRINNPRVGEGGRYVEFARKMEQKITAADANIPVSRCLAAEGTPAACLVDSICQDNYSHTLSRIAKELVLTSKYTLNPPAEYPPGVVVIIKGGRFGDQGVQLVYGVDFDVSADGGTLSIKGDKTPQQGETVEIYFIVM
jgi:hypothetical protein